MPRLFSYPVSAIDDVHDGDTCTVTVDLGFHIARKVPVRVMGVDTPEMSGSQKIAAMFVRDAVQRWLGTAVKGPGLTLFSLSLDKYGRVLGRLDDGTRDLSEYLLRNKLALPYSGGTKQTWSEELLAEVLKADVSWL
jgi:endonuclease YncB( thermonuclease family)